MNAIKNKKLRSSELQNLIDKISNAGDVEAGASHFTASSKKINIVTVEALPPLPHPGLTRTGVQQMCPRSPLV